MKEKHIENLFVILLCIFPFIFVIFDIIFWNKVSCPACKKTIERKIKCPCCGEKQNNPQCPNCHSYLSWK